MSVFSFSIYAFFLFNFHVSSAAPRQKRLIGVLFLSFPYSLFFPCLVDEGLACMKFLFRTIREVGKMKRFICAVFLVCLFSASAFAFVVPVKRTDSWAELKQINLQALQGEFMKFATSIQGLQSMAQLKDISNLVNKLKSMIDQFSDFSFDLEGVLGELSQELLGSMSFDSAKVSSNTKQAFRKKIFKTGSIEFAKDVEKQMKEQADKIRSNNAGSVSSAIGGLSEDSQKYSKERIALAVEELGKTYPASVPNVQESVSHEVYVSGSNSLERATGAQAFAETVRSKAIDKSLGLMAPYLKDKDGKSAYDKKMEEIQKSEDEINKKLEEDVKKSGNELEVLRNIASMTSALVQRQANTNQILAVQVEQAKDEAEMLGHLSVMLAEIYGKSVGDTVRSRATDIDLSAQQIKTK